MDTGTRPEKKNIDTNSSAAPPLTSSFSTPALLNGCAQGTNNSERVGRKSTIKSVSLKYTHVPNAPASQCRILIVYDKQPNGSLPTTTDVIPNNSFTSHTNLGYSDRFVVIMDEVSDSSQSSAINISGSRYVKCNLETLYGGSTNGIASINSGALFLMAANNADPTIGVVSTLYYSVRVRYTDV